MKPETKSFYEVAVQRAVERVVADLDKALDLEDLARGASLSTFHFHRIFRGSVGETPLEMHRRLRMERAALSLLKEDTPVTEIAFAAGYETHEAFTRTFRAFYNCTPSDFRRNNNREASDCERPLQIELATRSGIHFSPTRLEPIIHFIEGDATMDVSIKEVQELRVATVRHVGPYNQISEAFTRLGEIAGRAGLFGKATGMLGMYHDDPETTPACELRSDAGIVIPSDVALPDGLAEQTIPAGRYACTTHIGPYEQLGDIWSRFMGEWLPKSGHRMKNGVSFELYRNTPADVPKEKLETEIFIPLAE